MDIQLEKLEIMKLVLETDNPSVLRSIKQIFKRRASGDFWDELSEEQQMDILMGIRDVEQGAIIDYDSFMKKHR
ncbi:MAG: hypothetical protein ACK5IQ_04490 [Bacteroidales bacterium]